MPGPLVAIFHQPPRSADPPLSGLLAEARDRLLHVQIRLFRAAGAARVLIVPGREDGSFESFGERLVRLLDEARPHGGLILLGSGAVPLLRLSDARSLVDGAAAPGRVALTNNRYSSDLCAISDTGALRGLPALPSDNVLPRWLEEHAGFSVRELRGHDRLAIDLDTPLDLALLRLVGSTPAPLRALASERQLSIPRLDQLRALAADPRRELLVFGRSGARTLAWLERNVRCRVRFLAEERGLRASSPLAIGDPPPGSSVQPARHPAATLGLLLERDGPQGLASIVGRLADGAIIDTRVLLAHILGADEESWPAAEDRFASDLLEGRSIADGWLRRLTDSASEAAIPIQLGAHTLVGPGIRLVLRGAAVRHS